MELVTKYDTNDAKKESLMGGSKSAKGGGGPYPLADLNRGGPKHPSTLGNIGNAVKVLVNSHSMRENVRQWKKARLTGDVSEVFEIKVVVGSYG